MSPLQQIIQATIRETGTIDNGLSEKITEKLEPIIGDLIQNQANILGVSAQMLEGLLANPIIAVEQNRDELIRMSLNYSTELIKQVQKKVNADLN